MGSNSTPKIDLPKVIVKALYKVIKLIKKELLKEDRDNAKDIT